MKAKRIWVAVGLALSIVSAGAAPAPKSKAAPAAASRPRLALVIVVDGLSWDVLDGNRARLRGGLGRLVREGLVETACTYRHFITETAPGHAAMATGAPPSVTGIVANFWYERTQGGDLASVDAVSDPKAPGLYGPGRLLVPTLADRLVAKSKESRVVSISGKYRSAILLAGRDRRHSVYWLDPRTAAFLTTPYYDAGSAAQTAASRVVSKLNDDSSPAALEKRFGATWTRAPESTMQPVPQPELVRFQLPVLGRLFPHPLAVHKGGYAGGFYLSPYADEHLTDLALALLSDETLALGKRKEADVLAISFSTFDHIAHRYGPESAEALDALDRIDRAIARILAGLEEKLPKGAVAVALSSDHGFLPIRDVRRPVVRTDPGEDPGTPHGRLVLDRFAETLNQELVRSLCLDPASRPIRAVEQWLLFYDPEALPARTVEGRCGPVGREITTRDVDAALPAALKSAFRDSFDSVLFASERARWGDRDPAAEFARNTFFAGRSGDAFLVPRPGEMMHWDADTRGADHGSHHEYDIHVPLIFWGAAFPHAEGTQPSTPNDLAPTLAAILGVDLPDATGKSRLPAKR